MITRFGIGSLVDWPSAVGLGRNGLFRPICILWYYWFCDFIRFFIKWIPSWTASIPLLVAIVSGQLIINPFAFIIWGIWIEMEKNANRSLNKKGLRY